MTRDEFKKAWNFTWERKGENLFKDCDFSKQRTPLHSRCPWCTRHRSDGISQSDRPRSLRHGPEIEKLDFFQVKQ